MHSIGPGSSIGMESPAAYHSCIEAESAARGDILYRTGVCWGQTAANPALAPQFKLYFYRLRKELRLGVGGNVRFGPESSGKKVEQ